MQYFFIWILNKQSIWLSQRSNQPEANLNCSVLNKFNLLNYLPVINMQGMFQLSCKLFRYIYARGLKTSAVFVKMSLC